KKLIESAGEQVPLPKPLVTLLDAISSRQSNIIKRAHLITNRNMSFFRRSSDGYRRKPSGWNN
ncbi:unnamed protein product, partial [Adineta steineri]